MPFKLARPASNWRKLAFDVIITDLAEAMGDFGETANLLSQLDLVITVDTAMAHLAGAMGKEVWVLLPFSPIGVGGCIMGKRTGIPPCAYIARQALAIGAKLSPAYAQIWP